MDLKHQLSALDPAVRARVEEALKATLESELSKVAGGDGDDGGGGGGSPFSRSKGWVFSRSKTSEILRDPPELIQSLQTMDDSAFQSFAKRLVALKQMKDKSR
jgi:hypothetical protein